MPRGDGAALLECVGHARAATCPPVNPATAGIQEKGNAPAGWGSAPRMRWPRPWHNRSASEGARVQGRTAVLCLSMVGAEQEPERFGPSPGGAFPFQRGASSPARHARSAGLDPPARLGADRRSRDASPYEQTVGRVRTPSLSSCSSNGTDGAGFALVMLGG